MATTLRFRIALQSLAALGLSIAALLPCAPKAQDAGISPEAAKIFKASTDYLAGQARFSVETRSTIEVELTSGQKIQFDQAVNLSMQRPNKLLAERRGDLVDQVLYYDGKTLVLFNPNEKYFASAAVPDTLEGMLDFAREQLDIIAPAGDLLYKNAFEILMKDVMSGFVVGKGVVEGVRCHHLAFRNATTDWQIWIQEGSQPLPRKLVITTKEMDSQPQFSVVMTKWNLDPKLTDRTFEFSPPKDAKKVDFLNLESRGVKVP